MNKLKTSGFYFVVAPFLFLFFQVCWCNVDCDGVSVIIATTNQERIETLFSNYNKQNYPKKELLIVLNKEMDVDLWREAAQEHENVKVYQVDENNNFGRCINIGFEHARYDYIAKMNDNCYYSEDYISRAIAFFEIADADIIGKAQSFLFLEDTETLALRQGAGEYVYSNLVAGGTLVMKRCVLERVKFREEIPLWKPFLSDMDFCKTCSGAGFKIFSIDKSGFCYVRRANTGDHTRHVRDKKIMKLYRTIIGSKKNIEDCKIFIDTN